MVSNKLTLLTIISNLCLCLNLTFNLLKIKHTRYTSVKWQVNNFGQFEDKKKEDKKKLQHRKQNIEYVEPYLFNNRTWLWLKMEGMLWGWKQNTFYRQASHSVALFLPVKFFPTLVTCKLELMVPLKEGLCGGAGMPVIS